MVANSAGPRRQPSEPGLVGTSTARFRYLGGVRNHRRVHLCRGYWQVKSVLPYCVEETRLSRRCVCDVHAWKPGRAVWAEAERVGLRDKIDFSFRDAAAAAIDRQFTCR